jgi:hypothetical protein
MNHHLQEPSTLSQTEPTTNINPAPLQTSITFNRLKHLQSLIKEEAASRELCTHTFLYLT